MALDGLKIKISFIFSDDEVTKQTNIIDTTIIWIVHGIVSQSTNNQLPKGINLWNWYHALYVIYTITHMMLRPVLSRN